MFFRSRGFDDEPLHCWDMALPIYYRVQVTLYFFHLFRLFQINFVYSILVVAVWYIIWSNIGKVEEHIDSIDFLPSMSAQGSQDDLRQESGHKEALIVSANFTSSNRGLFAGFLIFVITLALIIIQLFLLNGECGDGNASISRWIAQATDWSIYAILMIATIAAYVKLAELEVNPDPISFLDDLLLFICIPSFILYALVSLTAEVVQESDGGWGLYIQPLKVNYKYYPKISIEKCA